MAGVDLVDDPHDLGVCECVGVSDCSSVIGGSIVDNHDLNTVFTKE